MTKFLFKIKINMCDDIKPVIVKKVLKQKLNQTVIIRKLTKIEKKNQLA